MDALIGRTISVWIASKRRRRTGRNKLFPACSKCGAWPGKILSKTAGIYTEFHRCVPRPGAGRPQNLRKKRRLDRVFFASFFRLYARWGEEGLRLMHLPHAQCRKAGPVSLNRMVRVPMRKHRNNALWSPRDFASRQHKLMRRATVLGWPVCACGLGDLGLCPFHVGIVFGGNNDPGACADMGGHHNPQAVRQDGRFIA